MAPKNKDKDQSKLCVECGKDNDTIAILKLLLDQQEKNHKAFENNIMTQIKDSFSTQISGVSNEVFTLSQRIDTLEKYKETLEKKNDELVERVVKLETKLEQTSYDVDEIESYSRRSCLIVHGLKPEGGKTDEETFLSLCENKFSNCGITSDHIGKIHRIRNNQRQSAYPDKPDILVVKFAQDRFRDKIFKNKKNLKDTGITITEMLTAKRNALLKSCLERIPGGREQRAIWTDNGKILVKLGTQNPAHIKCLNDIETLLRSNGLTPIEQHNNQHS